MDKPLPRAALWRAVRRRVREAASQRLQQGAAAREPQRVAVEHRGGREGFEFQKAT